MILRSPHFENFTFCSLQLLTQCLKLYCCFFSLRYLILSQPSWDFIAPYQRPYHLFTEGLKFGPNLPWELPCTALMARSSDPKKSPKATICKRLENHTTSEQTSSFKGTTGPQMQLWEDLHAVLIRILETCSSNPLEPGGPLHRLKYPCANQPQ